MTEEIHDRVSVLIPARNEEENIERAVRSVAAQREVREIIVVDDQSTDRTPAILDKLKEEFSKLRTLRIDSLPAGWTGKTYALDSAVHLATGDWLLFTDADTEHKPESLPASLNRAGEAEADMLSLSPGQRVPTWWEKAVIPLVYARLARRFKFEEVSDPRSPAAAANGQYILIKRQAYNRMGGHEAVRAEVLEDVALARRVKKAGGRILFLPGAAWVETRMYRSFRGMWEGWTKNLFPLCGERFSSILAEAMRAVLLDSFPLVGLIVLALYLPFDAGAPGARWVLLIAMGILAMIIFRRFTSYRMQIHRLGFRPGTAIYMFAGAPIYSALLVNSALAHALGRVRWKGREYRTQPMTRGRG